MIQQSGFSGVRVTDNRSERPLAALTSGTLCLALATNLVEFAFNLLDALGNFPAVGFELRFAFAADAAGRAALPRQVRPEPREARQKIFQLRVFNLQFALARARALAEN